jgi:hypothetical protein
MPDRMNLLPPSAQQQMNLLDPRKKILSGLLDPNIAKRGNILPLGRTQDGSMTFATPQIAVDMLSSMMLPGAVSKGYNPTFEDTAQMSMDTMMGGMGTSGLLGNAPIGALGANVWHGSPHKWAPEPGFPKGRPRLDKIGTGEGAQAYGHGFYSAQKKGVGEDYFNQFNDPDNMPLHFKDKPVDEVWDDGIKERWADVIKDMDEGEVGAFTELMSNLQQVNNFDDIKNVLANISPEAQKMFRDVVEPGLVKPTSSASLYKLDLPDEEIAKMLDWDAPLHDQPAGVIEKLKKTDWFEYAEDSLERSMSSNPTPADVHRWLLDDFTPEEASAMFKAAGIPGVKYYDGASRSGGKGTRNYVTWDQDVLDRTPVLENGMDLLGNKIK